MIIRKAIILASLVPLGGCASPYYQSHRLGGGVQLVARDASLSLGLVKSGDKGVQLCFQGAPDATFNQDSGLDVDASLANFGQGDDGSSEGSQQSEMVGRSPALLYARELFYRTCEVALSTNASPQEWREMFSTALQTSADIMKLEAANSKIQISEQQDDQNSATDSLAPSPPTALLKTPNP